MDDQGHETNAFVLIYTIEDQYFSVMIKSDSSFGAASNAFRRLISEAEQYKSTRYHSFHLISRYGLSDVKLHKLLGHDTRPSLQAELSQYYRP